MKSVIATVIVLATATTAYAGPKWNGNTGPLSDTCDFIEQVDGTMSYDEASQTWTVTTPATAKVKTRNANNMNVTAGELVGNTGTHDVTVQYTGSSITKGGNTVPININTDSISAQTSTTGTYTVTLDGSATMDDANTFFDANVAYSIEHTITCTQ